MSSDQKVGKVLGSLESEVMEIMWQDSQFHCVRFVTEKLQKKRRIAYTTVMTIMTRLFEKGLLKRRLIGKSYEYRSRVPKDTFVKRMTHQLVRNFISSFGESAIAHFAEELENIPASKKKKLLAALKNAEAHESE
jgi:predicted transcriptional regulator